MGRLGVKKKCGGETEDGSKDMRLEEEESQEELVELS